jgi:hypothetical protein
MDHHVRLALPCSRILKEVEDGCPEFKCSYTKEGSPPEDVYCFKDGGYDAETADTCPSTGGSTALPGASEGSTSPGMTEGSTVLGVTDGSTSAESSESGSTMAGSTGSTGSMVSSASTMEGSTAESTTAGTAVTSALSSEASVEGTKNAVDDQRSQITANMIAEVKDQVDDATATLVENVQALLDTLSTTLADYKLVIASRRRKREDGCSSVDQQLVSLNALKTTTESLIQLCTQILAISNLPDVAKTFLTTIKLYHENHLDQIKLEISTKESLQNKCGATTSVVSTEGSSAAGSTAPSMSSASTLGGSTVSEGPSASTMAGSTDSAGSTASTVQVSTTTGG